MLRGAIQRARAGNGPTLLEADTYRYFGHHTFELKVRLGYRGEDELTRWRARDPLDIAAGRLPEQVRESVDAEVELVLDEAVRFARSGARLDPLDAQDYTHTSGSRPRAGVS